MSRIKKRRPWPDLSFEMRPHKPRRAKGFLYTQKYIPDDRAEPPEEPLIKVIPREEWGAMPPKETAAMTIPTTHVRYNQTRTDSCMFKEECIGILQKIQKEHMEVKGMNDIQYHFMIGGDGTVYEGRGWKNKGEKHPGIKEKEYYDVAYIGNYDKYQVPQRLIFSLYDFLEQIETSSLVTIPYVFFNDLKELEKTPEDLLTHEVFGHISNWDVIGSREEYNTTPIANKDIHWTEEERERGHETGELKLTPEEIDYLFADKHFTTEEDDAKRIEEWAEKNRSYYEPHYADVILQKSKDEYEKIRGIKYDEDGSEWAMTMINPPPPPRVYRDPKLVHGEESIITQIENLMRPGAPRFDKYGTEIPMDNEKEAVSKEEVCITDGDNENSSYKGISKIRQGKKLSNSREDDQEGNKELESEMPSCFDEEYIDEKDYLANYSLDRFQDSTKPSTSNRRNLKGKAVDKQEKHARHVKVDRIGGNIKTNSDEGNVKKRRGRKPRGLKEENKETYKNSSKTLGNVNEEAESVIDKTTSGFNDEYKEEKGNIKVKTKSSTTNRKRVNRNTSVNTISEQNALETEILFDNNKKKVSKGQVNNTSGNNNNDSDGLKKKLRGRKPRVSKSHGLTERMELNRKDCTDLDNKEDKSIKQHLLRNRKIPASFQDNKHNSRKIQTFKENLGPDDSIKKEENDKSLRFQIKNNNNKNKENDSKSEGLYKYARSGNYVLSNSAKRRIQLMKERSKEKS